jgi:hypothetical protein
VVQLNYLNFRHMTIFWTIFHWLTYTETCTKNYCLFIWNSNFTSCPAYYMSITSFLILISRIRRKEEDNDGETVRPESGFQAAALQWPPVVADEISLSVFSGTWFQRKNLPVERSVHISSCQELNAQRTLSWFSLVSDYRVSHDFNWKNDEWATDFEHTVIWLENSYITL